MADEQLKRILDLTPIRNACVTSRDTKEKTESV